MYVLCLWEFLGHSSPRSSRKTFCYNIKKLSGIPDGTCVILFLSVYQAFRGLYGFCASVDARVWALFPNLTGFAEVNIPDVNRQTLALANLALGAKNDVE